MRNENMSRVAMDLLSIPPLIFRLVRRKVVTDTLAEIDPTFKLLHFEILKVLKEEGTMHVAKIGEKLVIAKAQMTHLIDKLAELGFIERVTCQSDRRTVNISLTTKGKKFMEVQDALILNAVRENMTSLTDNELEALSGSLRRLRDMLFKLG
ncbi:MAG TPA: MarR family transcriptional regulator [Dehalococcoidales bacterium]|nr:MarR family transcriptional regulator [Dehalococcoidales bacterium]